MSLFRNGILIDHVNSWSQADISKSFKSVQLVIVVKFLELFLFIP